MTDTACNCGCSTMTTITNAEQRCGCGCECCNPSAQTPEQEIVELRRLRDAVDQRLQELEGT